MGRWHFGGSRSGWEHLYSRSALARTTACVLLLVGLAVLDLGSASASAEPFCTDTWSGGSSGAWQTASNWSAGHAPGSADVACIGSGVTVSIGEGAQQAGVLSDSGSLVIAGGSLTLNSTLEPSVVKALTISGGTLTGAATLDISGSFVSDYESTMSGSGSTILLAGSTGDFEAGIGTRYLSERSLINKGTLKLLAGSLAASHGALIENTGTIDVDGETPIRPETGGAAPRLVNSGTLQKIEGEGESTGSRIEVALENTGTVTAKKGVLRFSDGGSSTGTSAHWSATAGAEIDLVSGSFSFSSGSVAGTLEVGGASASVSGTNAETAELVLGSGSLSVTSGTVTAAKLTMAGGTLTGAGTMNVSNRLWWEYESAMTGSGSTVILPGASGNFEQVFNANIAQRHLVNEGTATVTPGQIVLSEGAELKNTGTLAINSEYGVYESSTGLASNFVNRGTLEKTETARATTSEIGVPLENDGTVSVQAGNFKLTKGGSSNAEAVWSAASGCSIALDAGSYSLSSSRIVGAFTAGGGTLTVKGLTTEKADLALLAGSLDIEGGTLSVETFLINGGELTGSGSLDVSKSFTSNYESTMSGSGSIVLSHGATGEFENGIGTRKLVGRSLINEGTLTFTSGRLGMSGGAVFRNAGTVKANVEYGSEQFGVESGAAAPLIVNTGTFEKTTGSGYTEVAVDFENQGIVRELSGSIRFLHPLSVEPSTQYGAASGNGSLNPWQQHSECGDPVSCATGNFSETQTDFVIGGRGVGLDLTRSYNSQVAAASEHGIFGYGWTSSFSDHLAVSKSSKTAVLHQADGSSVTFTEGSGEAFTAPAWTQDVLSGSEGSGYTLTLASQVKYKFAGSSGRLESVTDRDGNETTLTYNEAGELTAITDPTGRKIKLAYNGEGLVESAEDPMGHVVKYTYESGNLKSVTQPGETALRWQFKYDGSHEITEMVDGRGGKTINEYNGAHLLTLQKDPAERTLGFEYGSFHTVITNKTTGSVTSEYFNDDAEPVSITRGEGTPYATTESFTYDAGGEVATATDGDGYTTSYGYNSAGDRTSMVDPDKDETKWEYDSTHDVVSITTPKGETTTIKRESHGNPEVVERPAPESKTQTTKYKYGTHGELESVENPLKQTWKYEYDGKGDRTAEIDPIGNKRTWEYNEDSQVIATVSPRGNVSGGKPAEFTTKIERGAQGRPLTITDPLKHTTKYKYDGDGNVEKMTDANSHTTTYTYNGDNQPIKVEAPNKATTETEYDGAGQVVAEIDGNKHKTKYLRNALEQVTEIIDPLGHVTKQEYDAAGNLTKVTDPEKRTTSYHYDPANRLTETSYSSGNPATVTYEYDSDSDRTKMTDGTGTTKYTYDQLDRLTESENGHKETVKYEYNLANEPTKVTYPNGKAVTRAYDNDDRLEKATDWLGHATKFFYNPDSELNLVTFPTEPKEEDKYNFNDGDQLAEVKMLQGTETLASFVYTRDNDGQVKKTTSKGVPGEETIEDTYDENNRLTKAGSTEYKYDPANNPTQEGSSENKYNEDDELEKSTGTSYTYNELGERTKATPEKGPASTYGYDQAGSLISVERPEGESKAKISDGYAYNGEDLRISEDLSGTTNYLAWGYAEEGLPLLLSNGTYSFVYGPGGLPIEQINNSSGVVTYLHHDQQGSTRLLTGSTGKVEGAYSYSAYGTPEHTGTATTPLGYDGQYTSTDTGLIYMRARVYDPATAQFLTVDPLVSISGAPYNYAGDNPLTYGDSLGLLWTSLAGGAGGADAACGATFEIPVVDVGTCGAAGIATGAAVVGAAVGVVTAVAGSEGGDEGEAELHEQEVARENCGEISPNFNNPAESPGEGWEWRGNPEAPVGSNQGAWVNPETGETLHPDLGHGEPIGPHFDYRAPDGSEYRIFPDGRIEPKE